MREAGAITVKERLREFCPGEMQGARGGHQGTGINRRVGANQVGRLVTDPRWDHLNAQEEKHLSGSSWSGKNVPGAAGRALEGLGPWRPGSAQTRTCWGQRWGLRAKRPWSSVGAQLVTGAGPGPVSPPSAGRAV